MGWQPHRTPVLKREAKKNKNQEAKRNLIPSQQLETAAKRRREPEGEAPQWGLGQSPKQGMGRQPHRTPVLKREAHKDKNQEAKQNLIPPQLLETAAKRRREPEGGSLLSGVWGKAPSRVWGGNPIVPQ